MAINQPRSFLRWAGSKKQILPILQTHWDASFTRYVEPFAGSACLFFRIRPEKAILGDINRDLISMYVEVKYRVAQVIEELSKLEKGRENYLSLRGMDISEMSSSQKAARFIYLNRFCFNGLYRTNLKGNFNVPYGGERSGEIPSDQALRACSRMLKNAHLVPGGFEKVLEKVKDGDFVYLDPPYSVKAKRVFKEYNASAFAEKDLNSLRGWLENLANRNIKFLVSYAESDEADVLRDGFFSKTISVRRNIAGFSASRLRSNEILISSTN
ncbi:MAG TPA: Dam family site-specific DNA-(adenine-N6)-methyltransferase, partial [Pyrinomonadaceae bacterium]|nr:Dam family site-specific DNA-(adenine-N6)-methyltransferase [Pyrinomonadaceae bacterium]